MKSRIPDENINININEEIYKKLNKLNRLYIFGTITLGICCVGIIYYFINKI